MSGRSRAGSATTRRRFLTTIASAAATSAVGSFPAPAFSRLSERPVITHGVQSGDVTADSGMVWARTDRPARMLIEVATTDQEKALGLMFRSGNYLTAFAISFIPALFTITLIVAGQRVSGSLPEKLTVDVRTFANKPLHTGLTLIWTGNCVNLVLAVVLLGRLQRK